MVLSDRSILEEIENGNIVFEPPIVETSLSPHSVDIHLGDTVYTYRESHPALGRSIDLAHPDVASIIPDLTDTVPIPQGGFELKPYRLILAYTKERVSLCPVIAARLEGRSTLARFGLSIHATAPTIHPTFSGYLVLEICNLGRISVTLKSAMAIGQLIFERLDSVPSKALSSVWQNQAPAS